MCIIAAIPTKKEISKATLQRCWNNNPHGGGFMFTDGKKIHTFKEMNSFKRYWKAFVHARETYPQSSFVCHFRISTHGKINEENCHPFLVNPKLAFAHNGIIRNAPTSPDYSDTYMFNLTILQNLPNNFLDNVSVRLLIQEYIGSGSKLAFLSSDNKITLINEKAGQWDANGVWFSNGGYKEYDYFDAGGTRVTSAWGGKSKTYHNPSYKQGTMGFASAAFPLATTSKIKDVDWDKKLKSEKIDNNVVAYAKSDCCDAFDYKSTYEDKCGFCDKVLKGYTEKQNGYCVHCEDRYSNEWSF
jgi:glutamine amidotransferase